MSVTIPAHDSRSGVDLPRAVVRVDGLLCAATGAVLLVGAGPISTFLGLGGPAGMLVLGAVFGPYGLGLLWLAGRQAVDRRTVLTVALLNVVWVIVSVAVLLSGAPALTTGGQWAIAVMADLVALLALAQIYAVRQMR